MKDEDTILFTANTPCSAYPSVTLTSGTWYNHIQLYRPILREKISWIEQTVTAPKLVCIGTSDPNNAAFVSNISNANGVPLVVFVSPKGFVDTASFRREFKDTTGKQVLWLDKS